MKIDFTTGQFPGVETPPCDLTLAFDVLEHSLRPDQLTKSAADILRLGGIAIIQTAVQRYGFNAPFGGDFSRTFNE